MSNESSTLKEEIIVDYKDIVEMAKAWDSSTKSAEAAAASIRHVEEELEKATDPKKIKKLNKELKSFQAIYDSINDTMSELLDKMDGWADSTAKGIPPLAVQRERERSKKEEYENKTFNKQSAQFFSMISKVDPNLAKNLSALGESVKGRIIEGKDKTPLTGEEFVALKFRISELTGAIKEAERNEDKRQRQELSIYEKKLKSGEGRRNAIANGEKILEKGVFSSPLSDYDMADVSFVLNERIKERAKSDKFYEREYNRNRKFDVYKGENKDLYDSFVNTYRNDRTVADTFSTRARVALDRDFFNNNFSSETEESMVKELIKEIKNYDSQNFKEVQGLASDINKQIKSEESQRQEAINNSIDDQVKRELLNFVGELNNQSTNSPNLSNVKNTLNDIEKFTEKSNLKEFQNLASNINKELSDAEKERNKIPEEQNLREIQNIVNELNLQETASDKIDLERKEIEKLNAMEERETLKDIKDIANQFNKELKEDFKSRDPNKTMTKTSYQKELISEMIENVGFNFSIFDPTKGYSTKALKGAPLLEGINERNTPFGKIQFDNVKALLNEFNSLQGDKSHLSNARKIEDQQINITGKMVKIDATERATLALEGKELFNKIKENGFENRVYTDRELLALNVYKQEKSKQVENEKIKNTVIDKAVIKVAEITSRYGNINKEGYRDNVLSLKDKIIESTLTPESKKMYLSGKSIFDNGGRLQVSNEWTADETKLKLQEATQSLDFFLETESKALKDAANQSYIKLRDYMLQRPEETKELLDEYKKRMDNGIEDEMDPIRRRVASYLQSHKTNKTINEAYVRATENGTRRLELEEEKLKLRRERMDGNHIGNPFAYGLSTTGKIMSGFKDPSGIVNMVGGVLSTVGKMIANPSTALVTALTQAGKAAVDFANKAIEAYQSIEVIKTNLGVISGSSIEGDSLFNNIAQYAIKSPFGVQQTAEQATLLRQSGVYAEDLMETLKMVGDLAGGNADKMRRISNDYAQIVSNGKANMLQLRQFANAGVPIYKELSKELGKSNEAVRKMVKNGEIGADKIEKVLKNLTSEGGTFYKAVEKGAKTLKARTTNLQDIKTLAFSEMGTAIVNRGKDVNNESTLEKMLSSMERFFNYIYDNTKEDNDKKKYKNLKANEEEIIRKENEYKIISSNVAKYGSFEEKKTLLELNKLKDAYDQEERQNILFNEYNRRIKKVNNLTNAIKFIDEEISTLRIDSLNDTSGITDQYIKDYLDTRNDYIKLNEKAKNEITSRMYEAAFNSYFDSTYKSASETLEKGTKVENSLWSITDEMLSLYKQTDEYKKAELEKQKESFLNAKNISSTLSKISKKIGDKNVLDLSKVENASQFIKFSQLLSSGDKFNLNKNSYNLLNKNEIEEANKVNKEFQDNLYNALRIARTADKDISSQSSFRDMYNKLSSLTGKNFINDSFGFNRTFDEYKEMLDTLSKGSSGDKSVADFFKSVINPMITGNINANTNGSDVNISEILKEEQPLWARIIGSGLGLDAERVKKYGGGESLRLHAEEQYTRNITKSLLSTGAKNGMNTYALMGMIERTPGKYASDKDGTKNLQINWNKTSANMRKFALEIGQAANVTAAYREVVENDVNTLSDLLANMPTTFEDVKNSKSFTDQFLNVFTGEVQYNGKTAYYDAQTKMITTLDGNTMAIYDVMDKIGFAETTMQELNKQLKERREELAEAKRIETTNNIFEQGKNDFRDSAYGYIASSMGLSSNSSAYKNFVAQGKNFDDNQTWENYNGWTKEQIDIVKLAEEMDAQSVLEKSAAEKAMNDAIKASQNKKNSLKKSLDDEKLKLWKKFFPNAKREDQEEHLAEQDEYVINSKEYNDALKKYNNEILEINNNIKDLTDTFNSIEITKSADTIKNNMLKDKNIYNATNFDDVYKLAMRIYSEPMLLNQDRDIKDFSRFLNVSDITSSLSISNFGNRNEKSSGYLKDLFYNSAYGYNKYDIESIAKGRSIDIEAFLRSKERDGADVINNMMGDDSGDTLWGMLNFGGVGTKDWNNVIEKIAKKQLGTINLENSMKSLQDTLFGSVDTFLFDNLNSSLITLGESLRLISDGASDGSSAWQTFGNSFVEATKSLTSNMGSLMTTAGLKLLITSGSSMWAPAFALIAAGGMSSILSGYLNSSNEDKTEEQQKKLETLKDDLKDLLAQAKADAIYYEKEVSNKRSLTTTQAIAKVNDAVITPSGKIISTHPDDYLIATKTPQTLSGSSPVVNLNIVNNSGQQLGIRQTTSSKNGEINIEAVIEGVVNKGLANGSFDTGMTARDQRLAGRRVYM